MKLFTGLQQLVIMKDHDYKDEVTRILEEAPSARKALLDNCSNLLKVSEYCHGSYLEVRSGRRFLPRATSLKPTRPHVLQAGGDGTKALEETKRFATQSLASVSYQISSLANSVLSLLDAQANQLRHLESSINVIGQVSCRPPLDNRAGTRTQLRVESVPLVVHSDGGDAQRESVSARDRRLHQRQTSPTQPQAPPPTTCRCTGPASVQSPTNQLPAAGRTGPRREGDVIVVSSFGSGFVQCEVWFCSDPAALNHRSRSDAQLPDSDLSGFISS